MKQFEKQKEELLRIKLLLSYKVMPHDQTHWLKTLFFMPLRFNKAVASDQHNYANNIKMIKVCIN